MPSTSFRPSVVRVRCALTICITLLACGDGGNSKKEMEGGAIDARDAGSSECAKASDCADAAVATSCENSLDCVGSAAGGICDPRRQVCVECAAAEDCEGTSDCIRNRCIAYTPCETSLDCDAPEVCDAAKQRCVACAQDADCSDGKVCAANQCVVRTECVSDNQCTPLRQLCDKGRGYCVDCLTQAQCSDDTWCIDGVCSTGGCEPLSRICQGSAITECNAQGTGSEVVKTCSDAQSCRDGSCIDLACAPGERLCDGTVATRCNAAGSGPINGGTDCSQTDKTCVAGQCVDCGVGAGPLAELKLVELSVGSEDYVVLQNRSSSCPVSLEGLALQIKWGVNQDEFLEFLLPTLTLNPGQKLNVIEEGATAAAGEVVMSDAVSLLETGSGGFVALCRDDCSTEAEVLDLVAFEHGVAVPAYPAPVTFSPLKQLDGSAPDTKAYLRAGFDGQSPTFKASDWELGDMSRPYTATSMCPATQPVSGSICGTLTAMNCSYGAVVCSCFLQWTCN